MKVDTETRTLPMTAQRHHEDITFDVARLASHDIILGTPWLRRNNPIVNWLTGAITFRDRDHVITGQPTSKQRFSVDERAQRMRLHAASKRESPESRSRPTDTAQVRDDQQQTVREDSESDKLATIPSEYQEWMYLFRKEDTIAALPRHQPWDHEIKLQPGTEPTFGPLYTLSERELGVLREYIDENLKKGFIRESQSPAGYPILFVKKKDGTDRLCVDYRKLNDITIKNRYPLPSIGQLQDRLGHAKIFTSLDLRGAYNLIRMKEGEEWKTAFRTRYGHYEYTVMPFGLTNAPATCQALINNVLRAHLDEYVIAYLDDILVYSDNPQQHRQHVKETLRCLAAAGLRLKPEKCSFHQTKVEFLGFIISTEGVEIDPKKGQSIREWPVPTDVKGVQSFLGTANFNRRFIKGYSEITAPLSALTKKDNTWDWTRECQQAFDKLKQKLTSPELLIAFRNNEPARMETDASDRAIGACLLQQREGKWRPVAYH